MLLFITLAFVSSTTLVSSKFKFKVSRFVFQSENIFGFFFIRSVTLLVLISFLFDIDWILRSACNRCLQKVGVEFFYLSNHVGYRVVTLKCDLKFFKIHTTNWSPLFQQLLEKKILWEIFILLNLTSLNFSENYSNRKCFNTIWPIHFTDILLGFEFFYFLNNVEKWAVTLRLWV